MRLHPKPTLETHLRWYDLHWRADRANRRVLLAVAFPERHGRVEIWLLRSEARLRNTHLRVAAWLDS